MKPGRGGDSTEALRKVWMEGYERGKREAERERDAAQQRERKFRAALQAIAQGNLGPETWQADYRRIRAYAIAAILPDDAAPPESEAPASEEER